jgi:hypothetical protein
MNLMENILKLIAQKNQNEIPSLQSYAVHIVIARVYARGLNFYNLNL